MADDEGSMGDMEQTHKTHTNDIPAGKPRSVVHIPTI